MTMRRLLAAALLLGPVLLLGGAALDDTAARPLFLRAGHPSGAGGGAQACDSGGSGVCAQFQNGQTFVTWDDVGTDGAGGANTRYRVYRSTAPIASGNYTAATLIASYVLNNSAQLFGGDPDTTGGATFTQANRQDAARPMARLTDLGTQLPVFSGLQAYTALAAESAYYAVVSTDTSDGAPAYIGSAGPIAESVATPQPIKYAASGSRADNSYGQILTPSGKPVIFNAHASSSGGGAATNNRWGDYWEWFLTTAEGWQDGRATALDVLQDGNGGTLYPSLASPLVIGGRDTIWNPSGTGSIETYHAGVGMTPNPLVGPANRWYPTTANGIARMLTWAIDHYGADPNQLHWVGVSMGAWGGANTGMRMTSPRVSALWLSMPVWRFDRRNDYNWPGATWQTTFPFKATIGTCGACLGSVAASVLTNSGAVWGGAGGYADMPGFVAADPGTDLPVALWMTSKDDPYPISFLEHIEAANAFRSARRGHAFVWFMGGHDTGNLERGLIDCDWTTPDATLCYGKSLFRLDAPYIATTNSSIDDNPGTGTRNASGVYDGDYSGGINIGFRWTVTADTASAFDFTIDNNWMDRAPTAPQTTTTGTLASSGSGSVTVTDGSIFQSVSANPYFLIGGTEIVVVTNVVGNTLTYTSRGQLGTTAQAHASGEAIRQFIAKPTGPNGGPFSTMTVDVTPRRMQGFMPANGVVVSCTITPFGAGSTAQTPTVANGLFTLTGITINATGATSIACS